MFIPVSRRQSIELSLRFWFFALVLALSSASLWAADVTVSAASADYSRGLLWKIEKDGQAASYLFGTVHAEDPAVLALPKEVAAAFQSSQAFAMEVLIDESSIREATRGMFYRDGKKTLKAAAGDALYKRILTAVAPRGIAEDQLLYMKPWAVLTTIAMPEGKTGLFLDLALFKVATADGKATFGLETMTEQTDVFEGMSDADQLEIVAKTLDEAATFDETIAETIKAYLARDLQELVRQSNLFLDELTPRVASEFRRRLIIDRNQRMAERLEPIMARQPTFIAVGAMHLPGERGVLALLAARGYRVTAVY